MTGPGGPSVQSPTQVITTTVCTDRHVCGLQGDGDRTFSAERHGTVRSDTITDIEFGEGADPVNDQAAGGNDDTDRAEVKVVPVEEYDAMVAELAELRPLRSDLIAIRGIVTRRQMA